MDSPVVTMIKRYLQFVGTYYYNYVIYWDDNSLAKKYKLKIIQDFKK